MGGYGSGRQGGLPTSEATASFVLSAGILTPLQLQPGQQARGQRLYGEDHFPVDFLIDLNAAMPWLELAHRTRNPYGEGTLVRYRVRLTTTVPTFGGQRWWFVCPRTGRRVAKLYLPLGGWYFWSRRGYGLGYACQRETPQDRAIRKARKLRQALGGDDWGTVPDKPKGMRWPTFERKYAALAQAEAIAEAAADQALWGRLARLR